MKYYLEGSLDEWTRRNRISKKLKVRFSFEIASALRAVRSYDLAHCNNKSQNVLIDILDEEEHCFVSDFGITQILSDSIIAVKTLQVLSLRGISCSYASPESLFGFRSKKIWDFRRSDVYSFGCLVYESTTTIAPWIQISAN